MTGTRPDNDESLPEIASSTVANIVVDIYNSDGSESMTNRTTMVYIFGNYYAAPYVNDEADHLMEQNINGAEPWLQLYLIRNDFLVNSYLTKGLFVGGMQVGVIILGVGRFRWLDTDCTYSIASVHHEKV